MTTKQGTILDQVFNAAPRYQYRAPYKHLACAIVLKAFYDWKYGYSRSEIEEFFLSGFCELAGFDGRSILERCEEIRPRKQKKQKKTQTEKERQLNELLREVLSHRRKKAR